VRAAIFIMLAGCSFAPARLASSGGGGGDDDAPARADAAPTIDGDHASWWNPSWSSRVPLSITNNDATALPAGFQIGLRFDLDAAPCTGSRDAARIVYGKTSELDRVIDEVGTDEWTWFRLQAPIAPTAISTEYWLYCGNPSPGAAPQDPVAVFEFYDSFPGTTVNPAWTAQSQVTVAGGVVTMATSGAPGSGIHSNSTIGPGTAIDYIAIASSGATTTPYWWGGYQSNFSASPPWVIWHAVSGANQIHPSSYDGTSNWNGTPVALDTSPHLYGVEHYGDSAAWRYNDVVVETHVYGVSMAATSFNVRLHNYASGGDVSFDMARVRKAANPPPTVSVGTIETY
jgi:hypothetical protein